MNVHLGTTKYTKSISSISLVVIGEEKCFSICSNAIHGGCLPNVYWSVVSFFRTIILH